MATAFQLAGVGAAVLALMMFVIWLVSVRLNNAGFVDVGGRWGLSFSPCGPRGRGRDLRRAVGSWPAW